MKNRTKHNHITVFAAGDAATQSMVGTEFRKQVVKFGEWVNPMFPIESMTLDEAWAQQVVDNFNAKVVDRVPVPLDHTDEVEANTGEVMSLEIVKGDGLYAVMEIRRPEVVDDINNGLIFDVSISFDWNYVDTAEGDEHGPVLLHVALVNNPYLKGMKPFEQLSEAVKSFSRNLSAPYSAGAIMLSKSKAEELKAMETATIKNDRDFDVTITVKDETGADVTEVIKAGEELEVPKDQSEAVLAQVAEATAPEGEGEGEGSGEGEGEGSGEGAGEGEGGEGEGSGAGEGEGDEEDEDGKKSDAEKLSDARKKLAKYELSEKYDKLLAEGKITPAQKDKFLALADVRVSTVQLSDGKKVSLSEIVAGILGAGPKVLNFSEDGTGKNGEGEGEGEGSGSGSGADKKPSESLSEEERRGLQATGVTTERMDELAAKDPVYAAELKKLDEANKSK